MDDRDNFIQRNTVDNQLIGKKIRFYLWWSIGCYWGLMMSFILYHVFIYESLKLKVWMQHMLSAEMWWLEQSELRGARSTYRPNPRGAE